MTDSLDDVDLLRRTATFLRQADVVMQLRDAAEEIDRLRAALTAIRDTLPERQDAYAILVFAIAANALEPDPQTTSAKGS